MEACHEYGVRPRGHKLTADGLETQNHLEFSKKDRVAPADGLHRAACPIADDMDEIAANQSEARIAVAASAANPAISEQQSLHAVVGKATTKGLGQAISWKRQPH